jgi:competence protein ComEA
MRNNERVERQDRERALTAGLLILIAVAGAWALWPPAVTRAPLPLTSAPITVSVQGAVKRPGTYTLPWGSRVGAALAAAGGLAPGAEASLVNPAALLEDEAQVVVPAREVARTGQAPDSERVNLNSASLAELEALPGIGPALAARLAAARPLEGLSDLDAVQGIGPKLLERLAPLVRF